VALLRLLRVVLKSRVQLESMDEPAEKGTFCFRLTLTSEAVLVQVLFHRGLSYHRVDNIRRRSSL
jgi:hypothetical protein